MLAGTIPIASRVGGIPEIVEGTYADYLTFMPGDPEEIVGKIEKVLSLPQSRLINIGSELGEIIRRKFNNSALRQRLLKVFSG
jgi:glycosyltransferase involved in cell wall biosynthesis